MPLNFQNGKIYAIRSHQTEQIYIGSTTQPLYKRFHRHKTMYCSSKEIMKYPDCYIELLENYACADKNELNRREGELIRLHNSVNKNIAGRTKAEYREEHKTEIKQYYVDNKTEIKEKNHQKYNCFCGGKYTNNGKTQHFKTDKHTEFIQTLETTTA